MCCCRPSSSRRGSASRRSSSSRRVGFRTLQEGPREGWAGWGVWELGQWVGGAVMVVVTAEDMPPWAQEI